LRWPNLTGAVRHWLASEDEPISEQVDVLPDRLAPGKLYFVGEGIHCWGMAMLCPCGCGESIHLNFLSDTRSGWQVTYHPDETVSLHPAIRRQNGCGSYVFVRRSRVYWWNIETLDPRTCSADIAV